MKNLWFCFLYITAAVDLWKREIPVWIFIIFGFLGTVGAVIIPIAMGEVIVGSTLAGIAGSVSIGVVLLLLSYVSRGAVGEGDAWFFLVTGMYVPWQTNLGLLCYGLLFGSFYGMGLMLWGKWKGVSVKGKKIPFLPFVWIASFWLVSL